MASLSTHRMLAGTALTGLTGLRVLSRPHPDDVVEFTLLLRADGVRLRWNDVRTAADLRQHRRHYTHDEYAEKHGSTPAEAARIEAFAQKNGLDIIEKELSTRTFTLRGSAGMIGKLFRVDLQHYDHASGTVRAHEGAIHVPNEIASLVEGVFGLDTVPIAEPHIRHLAEADGMPLPDPDKVPHFTPPQLAQLYEFPQGVDGSGQCIAILELGGGYVLEDLDQYFGALGLKTPRVIEVPVAGSSNQVIGEPLSYDAEVMLDIEVAGAAAPGATLAVYFAPNTAAGWLRGLNAVVSDRTHKPSVLSISWGTIEDKWTRQTINAIEQVLAHAAAIGITVCASAGDHGSLDGKKRGAHVNYPSSSQWVLGCGGTALTESDTVIRREVVWNNGKLPPGGATGGGVSTLFALPEYQNRAGVPPCPKNKKAGRGIPDVAADADPHTGYLLRVDGVTTVSGGTSAATPLWAALVARINQSLVSRVGFLNPVLYTDVGSKALEEITEGDNGAFHAGPGWNACTGWGTPRGTRLRDALRAPKA